jgi:two-component system, cell cycle response regulator DivK
MKQALWGARVLVVEDNPLNLELVTDILEAHGYTVLVATDGREALEMLDVPIAALPDLVLMDIQIPQVDGLTVTRRIKADPLRAWLPVIALTAHAMRGDERVIFEAGCDDYIAKPFELNSLLETVARHLPLAKDHAVGGVIK